MECFLIVTVLWIFSVCLHEFSHAWVAYHGGDITVESKGYLTMNPLRYTHPVLSIVMPVVFVLLGGIGLPGGAVYIDRTLLRSRWWDTAVSLAGPAADILFCLVLALAFKAGVFPADPNHLATMSMAFLLQLQISAVMLNLLPIPPLDGFQAIAPWLPYETRARLYEFANTGTLLVFMALCFVKPVNHAFWGGVHSVSDFLGVPPEWGESGRYHYQFWRH